MPKARFDRARTRLSQNHAAVFVNYDNLHALFSEQLDAREHPDEFISELLDELCRHLLVVEHTQTTLMFAYADFSELRGNGPFIQRSLYLQGADPRYVPSGLHKNAVEMQLCVDAMDLLHTRPDIHMFVIVTGDAHCLPLIQKLKRHGREAMIVALENPTLADSSLFANENLFIDAIDLLSEPSRNSLQLSPDTEAESASGGMSSLRKASRGAPVPHRDVAGSASLLTLEIIEEHFGQYDEVYLTPLLRKLSEVLGDEEHDPKSIISELEDAGAVWLEKRRGFPYDYTVLLVDKEHPDVRRIQLLFEEQGGQHPSPDSRLTFEDDDYDDEEYLEDYRDEEEFDETEWSDEPH